MKQDIFVRGSGWFGTWHFIGALLLLGIVEFAIAWWGMRRMQLYRYKDYTETFRIINI
ncbi:MULTISPECIES: hypothetical protein [Cyanophyceae]|uniref:hypothetical protein n=1 Tax=Cyanophyceae TaxID=3028117 RepID=UPI00232B533C|nr:MULTISPECIES: hypothetical protein [Cyanophyceae]MDB9354864.1 hypothetical protein [Nodularia spumigena CS-587/03]MDB9316874.1 hypothetical protein [Nodularia spumigena CS-590/01A]MDB9322419.1 hypothetical protein [Nodularia spumigena CS-591/07A]MDB9328901.1 hypothetical protein [Nodularia spumigena CS-590/02]MDB9330451.1 hypothetical protein [Nodularia spumigena CS-591/04]